MESNEQKKLMNKIETEAWNRPTAITGEVGREDWRKEGEGVSQRTYMHKSWTQTTVW